MPAATGDFSQSSGSPRVQVLAVDIVVPVHNEAADLEQSVPVQTSVVLKVLSTNKLVEIDGLGALVS